MSNKSYYMNQECKVIYQISDRESLIEITTHEFGECDDYGDSYCEPLGTKLIVKNEYLQEEPVDVGKKIKELELTLKEKEKESQNRIAESWPWRN